MNGNKLLLDTNILIYVLNGDENLIELLEGYNYYISFITEIELMSNCKNEAEKSIIRKLLNNMKIIDINLLIKEFTIQIRQQNKVKLPDAIIAGTSKFLDIPLITADKGFEKISDVEIFFYNHNKN